MKTKTKPQENPAAEFGRTSDFVANKLRHAIARGTYQSGERIYQEEIANSLNVSRQPVRQALQRLQAEGLLTEARPGRLIVSKISPAEVRENISIRLLLEPEAARLAAENITAEEIAELRRLNKLIVDDKWNKANYNYEFHKIIAEASRSQMLARFIDRLWCAMPTTPMNDALRENTASHQVVRHDQMVRALERRDGAKAEEIMRSHIQVTLQFHMRIKAKDQLSGEDGKTAFNGNAASGKK
jgi:DNA-binding GntR family transcriptional regulator